MVRTFQLMIVSFVLLSMTSVSLAQQDEIPDPSELVQVKLESPFETIQPDSEFPLNLEFEIKKGWHIYWQNPGDSGLAAKVDWKLPLGFKATQSRWPTPKVYRSSAGTTLGYEDSVVLVLGMKSPLVLRTDLPVKLAGTVHWLACKESCVPGESKVSLKMEVDNEPPDRNSGQHGDYEKALRTIPTTLKSWNVSVSESKNCVFFDIQTEEKDFSFSSTQWQVFPVTPQTLDLNASPKVSTSKESNYVQLSIKKSEEWAQNSKKFTKQPLEFAIHSSEKLSSKPKRYALKVLTSKIAKTKNDETCL